MADEKQRPLAQLGELLQGRASLAGEQASSAYESAFAQPKMSSKDAFMAGLIGLAPLIVGMIKGGKKGAYAGATGGLAGLQAFDTALSDEYKDKKERGLLQAKQASEQQQAFQNKALDVQQSDLSKQQDLSDDILLKSMFPDKGTTNNIQVFGQEAISAESLKPLRQSKAVADVASNAQREIADLVQQEINKTGKVPEFLKKFVGEDGKLQGDTWVEAQAEGLRKYIAGNETLRGSIDQVVNGTARTLARIESGLAMTIPEFEGFKRQIKGPGVGETNYANIMKGLKRMQSNYRQRYADDVDLLAASFPGGVDAPQAKAMRQQLLASLDKSSTYQAPEEWEVVGGGQPETKAAISPTKKLGPPTEKRLNRASGKYHLFDSQGNDLGEM